MMLHIVCLVLLLMVVGCHVFTYKLFRLVWSERQDLVPKLLLIPLLLVCFILLRLDLFIFDTVSSIISLYMSN